MTEKFAYVMRPQGELSEEEFLSAFDALEAALSNRVCAHAPHANLKDGKGFCFMSEPDEPGAVFTTKQRVSEARLHDGL